MKIELLLSPERWAEETFGQVLLHDVRRTRRAVKAARVMVRDASASLPKQQHTWKEVKALYRLLDEPDVTFAALMQPHWSQTRREMQEHPITLLIQDTTELDLTHRHTMSGIGQIGDGKGRGLLLQWCPRAVRSLVVPGKSHLCARPLPKEKPEPKEESVPKKRMCGRAWSPRWEAEIPAPGLGAWRRSRSRFL